MVEIISTVIINLVTNFLTFVIIYEICKNIELKKENEELKKEIEEMKR